MDKRRRRPDILRIIALIVSLFLIVYAWYFIFIPKSVPSFLRILVPAKKENILLLGKDLSYNEKGQAINEGRTDTMVLVQLDPYRNKIKIVSIPRDSFVEIPGYGMRKINSAFVIGGKEMAKEAVSSLMGIGIDRCMVIELDGLVRIVDSLGGVKVFVDKDLKYTDHAAKLFIDLKKGDRKLNGKQAEEYLRFRHDALSDIGRVDRQQVFLSAVVKKLSSPLTVFRFPFLLPAVKTCAETDISFGNLVKFGNFVRMAGPENIERKVLPGNFPPEKSGLGCWFVDREGVANMLDEMDMR